MAHAAQTHRPESQARQGESMADHADARTSAKWMYLRLAVMLVLSFAWMYASMYAMVRASDDVYLNLNFVYMAALMAAPMALIHLALMRHMHPDVRLNIAIVIASLAVLVFSFVAIRAQVGVGDEEFIRSMIPHHSGAILMCEEASISDPQIRDLCARIIEGQRAEITEMKDILSRLD